MTLQPPPRPGPVHGLYPQRPDSAAPVLPTSLLHRPRAPLRAGLPVLYGDPALRQAQALLPQLRSAQAQWRALAPAQAALHRQRLQALLGRSGWQAPGLRTQALACAAAALQHTLGRNPFDTQLLCAQLLLQGRLAEMATGEGKTLAVALAAAVAALAGTPVHLMTANDYLVQRDAQDLQPFFAHLGLASGAVTGSSTPAQRRAAYACNITHCTAREVAFDHLRDRLLLQDAPSDLQQRALQLATPDAPQPLLQGLCLALVDEADSLLVDEATLPLVLADTVHDPAHRAWCVQALALARALQMGEQVQVQAASLQVHWTAQAVQQVAAHSADFGPAWQHAHQRQEWVTLALLALHALHGDQHYLVREGQVQLLDTTTGRSAPGRVWQQGLQTLVELKEGCKPSAQTRVCAQTTYQRFFARYLHLAGTSGTLAECRRELRRVYGLRVVRVPLRRPSRLQRLPPRCFANEPQRTAALLQRVQQLQQAARPVLVGVATVQQAAALSAQLVQAGVAHRVLDARHDADEAQVIAAAGQPGAVTVATAMAGRGTDIGLGPGVAQAGGLHVLLCQDNRCARLDRQFIGRAARQGEPGSAEVWWLATARAGTTPPSTDTAPNTAPVSVPWWHHWAQALRQRHHESQAMRRRRRLLEQELEWEKQLCFRQLHA